jgi:hypothetical protein
MATFAPGTGGTLKSVTLEQAIIELSERSQSLDEALTTPTGNLGIVYNANGNTCTLGHIIPISSSVVGGKPTFTATNFLTGSTFTPGTGGDLVSVNYPAALLELAHLMQAAEEAEPTADNNVQVTYDLDALTATVSAVLPVSYSIDATNGKTVITATPYLA